MVLALYHSHMLQSRFNVNSYDIYIRQAASKRAHIFGQGSSDPLRRRQYHSKVQSGPVLFVINWDFPETLQIICRFRYRRIPLESRQCRKSSETHYGLDCCFFRPFGTYLRVLLSLDMILWRCSSDVRISEMLRLKYFFQVFFLSGLSYGWKFVLVFNEKRLKCVASWFS